jgi:hypothetical protein
MFTIELTAWQVFALYRIIGETFLGTPERSSVASKVMDAYRSAAPPPEAGQS